VTSKRLLRIGLFGQFGIGNLGNEGSLEAMLRWLRTQTPEPQLICICSDPAFVRRVHGVEATPLRARLPPSMQALNKFLLGIPGRVVDLVHALKVASSLDVLLIPGTGILDDFGESPFGLPYDLWRWCLAGRLGGAKIGFVSIGAGPITRKLSRFFMIGAARWAHYRSYRDEPSRAFAEIVGLPQGKDCVRPDLAFGLPAPEASSGGAGASAPVVAVGVMAYYGWAGGDVGAYQAYVAKLAAYVAWLLRAGRRVRLVIGKDRDADAVADVRDRALALAPEWAQLLEPFEAALNLSDVMGQMASADLVVATRFHNVVCALRVGRPVISLGYAEKNRALVSDFGLGEFAQDAEDFDADLLQHHTDYVIARSTLYASKIKIRVEEYRRRLADQEHALQDMLGSVQRPSGKAAL
jgi:polysaccharide pyruvyl transferase WcaK-like protein